MAIAATPPSARTRVTVASSSRLMQSHSTLPCGVQTSSARWPMPNAGTVPMPSNPGSCSRQALVWFCRNAAGVVQRWPPGGTYCRSSSQIRQPAGGRSAGGNWVPQVAHRKRSTTLLRCRRLPARQPVEALPGPAVFGPDRPVNEAGRGPARLRGIGVLPATPADLPPRPGADGAGVGNHPPVTAARPPTIIASHMVADYSDPEGRQGRGFALQSNRVEQTKPFAIRRYSLRRQGRYGLLAS
jgi:hypothetical protein